MIALLLLACTGGDDTADTDTATPDDTGVEDVGPLPGWGELSGDCGDLADELDAAAPSFFANAIDLPGEPPATELGEAGAEVLEDGNLGGSSIWSEVFSAEVLARCEGATLLKTEAEVVYDDPAGKKTDLLVEIEGLKLGVSVTRAFKYPPGTPYEVADATDLLDKKLADVLISSDNVADADQWVKQALHVLAYDETAAASIEAAWGSIDAAVRADTVLYVTRTDGTDDFVY